MTAVCQSLFAAIIFEKPKEKKRKLEESTIEKRLN